MAERRPANRLGLVTLRKALASPGFSFLLCTIPRRGGREGGGCRDFNSPPSLWLLCLLGLAQVLRAHKP